MMRTAITGGCVLAAGWARVVLASDLPGIVQLGMFIVAAVGAGTGLWATVGGGRTEKAKVTNEAESRAYTEVDKALASMSAYAHEVEARLVTTVADLRTCEDGLLTAQREVRRLSTENRLLRERQGLPLEGPIT